MNILRTGLLAAVAALIAACSATPSKAPPAPSPPPAPAIANIAGVWTITTDSQFGSQDSKMTVAQTGKDIKGTLESQMGSVEYTGTVEGSNVKWGFSFNAGGTDLRIEYIGVLEAGVIKGKAVIGTFGEGTFVAKKNP